MLPEKGRLLPQLPQDGLAVRCGERIRPEAHGVPHGEAKQPAFPIHLFHVIGQSDVQQRPAEAGKGHGIADRVTAGIPQAKDRQVPALLQHGRLSEDLPFMGGMGTDGQDFRTFYFQNAHGGARPLPDQNKITMGNEGHFPLFAADFQLIEEGYPEGGQAVRHATLEPVTALQRKQTRQLCRK